MTPPAHAQHTVGMNTPVPPQHEKALLSMLSNMEELTSIYKTELDALELRDMQAFSDLQPKKVRLVQDCESYMTEINSQVALMKTISPALKERILSTEADLRALAGKSQKACQIRAESVKRVQDRLLDAARQILMRDKTAYNKRGVTEQTKQKPVATAINEAI